MSGLEPLAALGLACNIFQLVEVGCSTIKLAKAIYQSSSPAVDQVLQDNAIALSIISHEVKAAQRPANPSKLDKQLVDTADKCYSAARDLQEEVNFLLGNAKQKQLVATLKIVAKTTWRKRRLDRLKQSLENAEELMRKTLLAQIWSRTHAAELDLNNVKDDLRVFIQEYRDGSRDIKHLVSHESLITRKQMSVSSKATLDAIGGVQRQVNKLALETDINIDQAQREHLLRSLKFPAMNERRNQLSEAHQSTFEWIFVGDDGPSQEDVAESDLEDSDWEDSDLEDLDLADPSEAGWDLFSNWLSSTAGIYWISGKPGSGKTTLVKYVLNHPKTTTYLDTWSPHPLVISHFFWRPGSQMQQSIKGLLCSLLYQLLENSVSAANLVLQSVRAHGSGTKDEYTDWSVPELRSIFVQNLSSYERAVCIFIDGLDEVLPTDGPMELLDLMDQFARSQNAKLCLSSRPEPILEQRLSSYPHLRLQNLTRTDLERYAQDHVKLTETIWDETRSSSLDAGTNPIELLVDKAEGVFLWLVLAVKSINKGFKNGDTGEIIQQRIEHLPGDLTRLYKDMWNRACEDNPVAYRQIAALYFKLTLLSQRGPGGGRTFNGSSLLHLMLASTSVADQLLDAIDNPSDLIPEARLVEHCQIVERNLKLYCFGILETVHLSSSHDVVGWYGPQYDKLWSCYGRMRLQFIHRTAQDFLSDTVDGEQILNHDSTSESSLFFQWVRAHLAISQLYAKIGDLMSRLPVVSDISDYTDILDHFPQGRSCSGDQEMTRTICYLENLCSSGQLLSGNPCRFKARFCGGADFLKVAARLCGEDLSTRLKDAKLSMPTISEILLNVCVANHLTDYPHQPTKSAAEPLIRTLLCEGADPNWKSTAFDPWDDYLGTGFTQVRAPFTDYLNTMLHKAHHPTSNSTFTRPDLMSSVLKTLHEFLSSSVNLGDLIFQGLSDEPRNRKNWSNPDVLGSLWSMTLWASKAARMRRFSYLFVSLPAHIVLKKVLDHMEMKIEQSAHGERVDYKEMISLLSRNREYLDKWPTWEHARVVGRLAHMTSEDPSFIEDNEPLAKLVWYSHSDEYSADTAEKLMGELEACLLDEVFSYHSRTEKIVQQCVQQLSWVPQSRGLHDICQSLEEFGILAKSDYEELTIEDWVERFQKRLSTDGGDTHKIEVA